MSRVNNTTPTQPPTVYRYAEATDIDIGRGRRLVLMAAKARDLIWLTVKRGRDFEKTVQLRRADAERLRDWLGRVLGEDA